MTPVSDRGFRLASFTRPSRSCSLQWRRYPKIYGQFSSSDLRDVTLKDRVACSFFFPLGALCPQGRLAVCLPVCPPLLPHCGLPEEPSGQLPEGFFNASLVVLCRLGRCFGRCFLHCFLIVLLSRAPRMGALSSKP
jgi:hypothetical protein